MSTITLDLASPSSRRWRLLNPAFCPAEGEAGTTKSTVRADHLRPGWFASRALQAAGGRQAQAVRRQ